MGWRAGSLPGWLRVCLMEPLMLDMSQWVVMIFVAAVLTLGQARAQTKVAGQSPAVVSPAPANQGQQTEAQVVTEPPEIERFMDEAKGRLLREDWVGLDKMAEEVRLSKARFPGGGWKLTRFYEALKVPRESDRDWQNQLALLQRWTTARPHSITAPVALADAYLGYAWAARGSGYANTVTDQGWQLFRDRSQQAEKELVDAAALSSKCPHWYELMQEVTLALGADKEQHRAIFEKAITFEPLYFAYYQTHALALLPKWEGEPGDTEAFAEETYSRVGGEQGAYLYFEIVSNLCGRRGDFSPQGYSWQKRHGDHFQKAPYPLLAVQFLQLPVGLFAFPISRHSLSKFGILKRRSPLVKRQPELSSVHCFS